MKETAAQVGNGGVVVVPTRRWYMVCALAEDSQACSRIFSAKRRAENQQLLLVMPSLSMADDLVEMTPEANLLAERLWPGDLALLLRWKSLAVSKRFSSFSSTAPLVAVVEEWLGELAIAVGAPLAASSANMSGPADASGIGPAISLQEVEDFLRASELDAAVVVDGGLCPEFMHMTIVDCSSEEPARIVRSGAVHERAICSALADGKEV